METLVFIETDEKLSEEQVAKLKAEAQQQLGQGYRVFVVTGGMRVRVFSAGKAE